MSEHSGNFLEQKIIVSSCFFVVVLFLRFNGLTETFSLS